MTVRIYTWLLLALSVMVGCESLEDTYADHAGVVRYLGKCQNVSVTPGWNRLIVKWENHVDPVIENIKIEWKLDEEVKEVILEKGTTEYSISDLENAVYEVSVYSVDKDGNLSLPEIEHGRPYTSGHESILTFTNLLEKYFFVGNRLLIIFTDWQSGVESASLHYYSGGELITKVLDKDFLAANKCWLVPDKIDFDTPVVLKRSGRLTGCDDLIEFAPYELSHNKMFTTEFRQLCKRNYGVNMLTDEFINSVEELHYDYNVGTFEDILNFPNLKKLVLGKNRYLGNEYLDLYKSSSTVTERERSELAIRLAHEVLGITIDSYNEHYFPRGTFDFVNYLGNTSLPEFSFLDAADWTYESTPLDGVEGIEALFDDKSTEGWVKAFFRSTGLTYELIVDMQEVQEVNGLQISQFSVDPQSTNTKTHYIDYLAKEITIEVAEYENEWFTPFDMAEQEVANTSGETTIFKFTSPQRVRYMKFKMSQQRCGINSFYYGISLGKIRVF
ncbi:DUF4998 domain-containing protein [Butyricimonas sp.]|uniref:DUF4998 domain-containing protein n=1 Tax=Butyricimonas sp. TaxID=1969738 RepID=UPI0025C6E11F|nr:DUF4998 domain-containing protein [Butyricimonas sp.]